MTTENLIEFKCFDEETASMFPPIPANKLIPDWYKDVPVVCPKVLPYTETDEVPSIKRCIPVLDYLTSGYIIRNNYEIRGRQKVDDRNEEFTAFDLKCRYAGGAGAHPWYQAPIEINDKKNHYLKINQPWYIKTPPGYSCLIYQPHYFFRKEFSLFPGIVDTDKHTESIGLVGTINVPEFTIKPGDPLVVVFPFKREEWKMNIAVETLEQAEKRSSFKFYMKGVWHGMYSKFIHSKKSYK